MANVGILNLPVQSGLTGAEWVPLVEGLGVNAITSRAQVSAFNLTGNLPGSQQNANTVFAGPVSGGAQLPTFRALVSADIPAALQLGLSGTPGSVTFGNATSGLLTVQPVTGALGTHTLSLPAVTDTIAGLALANGGTNASLTASNGGIVYSTASALAILGGTATANQALLSGSSTTPAWSTATYPASTTINQLLYSSSANVIAGLATANGGMLNASSGGVPSMTITPTLGVQQTSRGTLTLANTAAGAFATTLQSSNSATAAWTATLPTAAGTNLQLLSTDGTGVLSWVTVAPGSVSTATPPYGFDAPVNFSLAASQNGTVLTIAIKDQAGNDPSATSPVFVPFRSATDATGTPSWVAITSALSMTTNAAGATLGTANSVPFRFWICLFNNAGTAALALINCVAGGATPTAIKALNEGNVQSTTAITGSATSAGVFYSTSALTSKAFRIIGYLEYSAGLATAGTYASNPTKLQLFGPGVLKPGAVVQTNSGTRLTQDTFTSNSYAATNVTASVSPTSACNLVSAQVVGSGSVVTSNDTGYFIIQRGGSNIGVAVEIFASVGNTTGPISLIALDAPGTTSSTAYTVAIKGSTNGHNFIFPASGSAEVGAAITVTELMA